MVRNPRPQSFPIPVLMDPVDLLRDVATRADRGRKQRRLVRLARVPVAAYLRKTPSGAIAKVKAHFREMDLSVERVTSRWFSEEGMEEASMDRWGVSDADPGDVSEDRWSFDAVPRGGRQVEARGRFRAIRVYHGPKMVGELSWNEYEGVDPPEIGNLYVDPRFQRQGVATEMLRQAREMEPRLVHSTRLSDDGRIFAKARPSPSRRGIRRRPQFQVEMERAERVHGERFWAALEDAQENRRDQGIPEPTDSLSREYRTWWLAAVREAVGYLDDPDLYQRLRPSPATKAPKEAAGRPTRARRRYPRLLLPDTAEEAVRAVLDRVGEQPEPPEVIAQAIRNAWARGPRHEFKHDVEGWWNHVRREPKMAAMVDRFGDPVIIPAAENLTVDPMELGVFAQPVPQAAMYAKGVMLFYDVQVANGHENVGHGDPPLEPGQPVVTDDSMAQVLRHEYGHHVFDSLPRSVRRRWIEAWVREAEAVRQDTGYEDLGPQALAALRANPVSAYMFEDEQEGFAEAFAAVMHPEYDRSAFDHRHGEVLLDLMEEILVRRET